MVYVGRGQEREREERKMSRREWSSPAARGGGQGGSGSTTAAGIVEDGAVTGGQTAGREGSIASEAGPPSTCKTVEELEGVTAVLPVRSSRLRAAGVAGGRDDGVRRQELAPRVSAREKTGRAGGK